jgi:8-oxo-dGTP diphosphatase
MKLIPVALCLFYKWSQNELEIWVQRRDDDGPYHGMLEFPGGKIEANEAPLMAAVREVLEEVGVNIDPAEGKFMGNYKNVFPERTIVLYVFLFPPQELLEGKGQWLKISANTLSRPFVGIIPPPNHRIIDDLYRSLYDNQN